MTTAGETAPRSGILVVDKPPGITSFSVVRAVRKQLGVKRVGHTGTLDPFATGVLPLCINEATKIAGLLLADQKAYEGEALLGEETDTLDGTGKVVRHSDPSHVTQAQLLGALRHLEGESQQVPPAFSALHVNGERAYHRARRGESVELPPRPISVASFTLLSWDPPRWKFAVRCSKGTYVRSLIRDVGQMLGCGATLTVLRRTQSGPFSLRQAVSLDDLSRQTLSTVLLVSVSEALPHLSRVNVSAEEATKLLMGQAIVQSGLPDEEPITLVGDDGNTLGIGLRKEGILRPKRMFVS